jgi:hypothetical protein
MSPSEAFNVVPNGIAMLPHWHKSIPAKGPHIPIGGFGTIQWSRGGQRGTVYVHRLDAITLWLTTDKGAVEMPPKREPDYSWAPDFWQDMFDSVWALKGVEIDMYLELVWLGLPCGECKTHFGAALERHPAPHSPEGYFAWLVDRRNDIRVRKGKPVVTLEEAQELYPRPA